MVSGYTDYTLTGPFFSVTYDDIGLLLQLMQFHSAVSQCMLVSCFKLIERWPLHLLISKQVTLSTSPEWQVT